MNKFWSLSILLITCLGLFGCPYESQVPINKPSVAVDKRLLGNWSSEDEVYNTYTISQSNPFEYHIVPKNMLGTARFKGFISIVKGATFMNVLSDSSKTYFLYRIKIDSSAENFTIIPFAKDLPEHFNHSQELNNYVWRNMNLKSFYDEDDQAKFTRPNRNDLKYN